MATKLISVLMLALLVLPSCCCLKQGDSKGGKKEECESKCCAELSATLPAPIAPLGSQEEPCDCEQIASQVLGLPEEGVTIAANLELDFATEWREIEVPAHFRTDVNPKPLVNLVSVLPPGKRVCQDYCVYRI
jgi:hypothetical protein